MSDNVETKLLTCPVRGELSATALAKDGVTPSEESRRIDFIHYLLKRQYPKGHIAVETVVIKNLGASGRNKLRADVIVYDCPRHDVEGIGTSEKLKRAILVAEIKRDSKSSKSGVHSQLKPALAQIPRLDSLGVYWDDINRILFTKSMEKIEGVEQVTISEDDIANLPKFGAKYKQEPITTEKLAPPTNLVALLFGIANIMRSHGINDESLRYRETVKLILARYCDERSARASDSKELSLQVLSGKDLDFRARVSNVYKTAAGRYSRAKTLFSPKAGSELPERTLKEVVRHIQGIDFTAASNETMQQVFMSFVPSVFKKALDQYFTPMGLIETMVNMCRIGPNDTIVDPAMGTADFLTAAMEYRTGRGDDDIVQRIFGADCDEKAYDLAVVNMILNKDGQSNLELIDSIENHDKWGSSINVALCNPPFGERSVEKRSDVLQNYDLGHIWEQNEQGSWVKTSSILAKQQLGILFIERCFKTLVEGGRIAIILPEGFLCTKSYGYVREWIRTNTRIVALIELPRRIFTKSDADLRGNIVVLQKLSSNGLAQCINEDYPIYTDIIRKVGFKMGAGFSPTIARDPKTGLELRDDRNNKVVESDFIETQSRFSNFLEGAKVYSDSGTKSVDWAGWRGARYSHISEHPNLDMKPRRLSVRAIENVKLIESGNYFKLSDIADIVAAKVDISEDPSEKLRLVEGIDIRAVEGLVTPQFPQRAWEIVERKQKNVYQLRDQDIIVGLVRPERRNIGLLLDSGDDIVGSPDGVAIIRIREEYANQLGQLWLFQALRKEQVRLQLWTESGGTSYGKLTADNIGSVLVSVPKPEVLESEKESAERWAQCVSRLYSAWNAVGTERDRFPIINSPIFGLEPIDDPWSLE